MTSSGDPRRVPPNDRRRRPTTGVLYCAMICFTLIIITLISTFGK